jgi:signal transduction histidine kinase
MPSRRAGADPDPGPHGHARAPLLVLSLAGVAVVAVIGLILVLYLRSAGLDHERREAEDATRLSGNAIVAPLVTPALLRGDRTALGQLDRAVRTLLLRGSVVRVKLWASDGRIAYSDEPRLIGRRFALEAEEQGVLRGGGSMSDLSELDRPENRFERDQDRLLQVYTRVLATDGSPLLFEAYQRFESIAADGNVLWQTMLPALLAGLLVLQLVNFGLARWFGDQIRGRERQRAALLARALDASDSERRRIAAELHDGVVQDLTGAGMAVDGATRALAAGRSQDGTRTALVGASESIHTSVDALRTLLIDFYPADLESRGLEAALADLVALARRRGLIAELDVAPGLPGPMSAEGLVFRVAQEGLRNAVTHSLATRVSVRVGTEAGHYWVEVRDNGTGFDTNGSAPDGHLGLRALRDLLADAGGRLELDSHPGRGSLVRGEIPV